MNVRFDLAQVLLGSAKHAEATEELAWLWEHMLEHEPAMVGVRNSYMAGEMQRLVTVHPPARVRFSALRDAVAPGSPAAASTPNALIDWMVLNEVLGDDERTLAWFDGTTVEERRAPGMLRIIELKAVPLLLARERWADVGALYPDPISTLRRKHEQMERIRAAPLPDGQKQQMVSFAEQRFRDEAATLHACLIAAHRDDAARAVAEEARRLAPGEPLEEALRLALSKVRGTGSP
jgi:hypothetical protein